jgi:hypothetical protein
VGGGGGGGGGSGSNSNSLTGVWDITQQDLLVRENYRILVSSFF